MTAVHIVVNFVLLIPLELSPSHDPLFLGQHWYVSSCSAF